MGFTTSYWQKERWSRRAADTLTSYGRCWNPSLGKRFACASAREKGHGDGGRCPPSDPIDGGLDLLRHRRSDRSPSWDSLLPCARLISRFPQQSVVGPLAGEISIHQIFLR